MYIEQGYKAQKGGWAYLPIPLVFFMLTGLSYVMIKTMNIDVVLLLQNAVKEKGSTFFLMENLSQFALGLFMVLAWVKWVHKQSLTSLTTARKIIDWKRVGHSFLIWGSIIVITTLIGIGINPEAYRFNFELKPFITLAVVAIVLIPLQTSFEEYLFRGYLMQGLGIAFKSRALPFIFTSITFGLMHIANPEVETLGYEIMWYYIGTGFFLGILTLMDQGLELALGFHAANNLVAALLITSNWTAFQTNSIFIDLSPPTIDYTVYLTLLVFYPLLLFYFSKKYKWSHWRSKLFGSVATKAALLKLQNGA